MTPLDIRLALLNSGITAPCYIGGANYARPTLAWLQGDFYDAFKADLWDENLDTWAKRWECRDFARLYACEAQKANAKTTAVPPDEDALAVGEFWFIPDAKRYGTAPGQLTGDPGEGHAIAICITDKGLAFVDPQNNIVWPMTTAELISCWFVRF